MESETVKIFRFAIIFWRQVTQAIRDIESENSVVILGEFL